MTENETADVDLVDWTPARVPIAGPIVGDRVRLEPLRARTHAAELYASAHGPGADPELWRFLPNGPFAEEGSLRAWAVAQEGSSDPLFFTIVDTAARRAAGVASYLRIEPAHGSIEIGHIWFGHQLQRTPQATEAIYLLLREAFDVLGYRRVEWKCNAANVRSRRAAVRFGFTPEGTFRQHMIVKGRNRDTAWFSILDREWPTVRGAFEAWLAPENFDEAGRQRTPLRR